MRSEGKGRWAERREKEKRHRGKALGSQAGNLPPLHLQVFSPVRERDSRAEAEKGARGLLHPQIQPT